MAQQSQIDYGALAAEQKMAQDTVRNQAPESWNLSTQHEGEAGLLERLNRMLEPLAQPVTRPEDIAHLLTVNPMLGGSTEGTAAALKQLRGPVGKGVQMTGRGMEAAGTALGPTRSLSLGGLAYLSHHPAIATAAVVAPPFLKSAGYGLQRVGEAIAGEAPAALGANTLGLAPAEQEMLDAIIKHNERLRTARAAGPAPIPSHGDLAAAITTERPSVPAPTTPGSRVINSLTGETEDAWKARVQGRLDAVRAKTSNAPAPAGGGPPPAPPTKTGETPDQTVGRTLRKGGRYAADKPTPTEPGPARGGSPVSGGEVGGFEVPPKPSYSAQEMATLQKLKAGEAVDPEMAKAALQKLRDALGSRAAGSQVGKPQAFVQRTTAPSGQGVPAVALRRILMDVSGIESPERARDYLAKAPYNVRGMIETILRKRGLIQ